MNYPIYLLPVLLLAGLSATASPALHKNGSATQLMVDEKPFLVRGGELGNSTASNLDYLGQYWSRFKELHLNTVLAPVYWDRMEPVEGTYDFSLVDGLIRDARKHGIKLVLLWFGTWKNSMSCYAPEWVKKDTDRFPRCRDRNGNALEILAPFHEEGAKADAKAFAALMRHIREIDEAEQTVIMVQPENEIGMIQHARCYSDTANQLYSSEVPQILMDYLFANRDNLEPKLLRDWSAQGCPGNGTWREVFGDSPHAEEVFMAFHFARYTDRVASAGKAEYELPMFVNAALIRPGYQPGQYVGAGPLPHLIDIWKAAAPSIDFISPDIYFPDFVRWTREYARSDNPLFIPEALRNNDASVNALYAFAEHAAIGFNPFGIESITGQAKTLLSQSYGIIEQLEPLIIQAQAKGTIRGLLRESERQLQPLQFRMDGIEINVAFEYALPPSLADGVINEAGDRSSAERLPAGGLVIQTGDKEFLFAGMGLTVTFQSLEPGTKIGIVEAEEGTFTDGQWKNALWLNGDQTHQGRHIRLVPGGFSIQRVKLYSY